MELFHNIPDHELNAGDLTGVFAGILACHTKKLLGSEEALEMMKQERAHYWECFERQTKKMEDISAALRAAASAKLNAEA